MAKVLIDAKADVHATDAEVRFPPPPPPPGPGLTPAPPAAGVRRMAAPPRPPTHRPNRAGRYTALHYAAILGDEVTTAALLAAGADPHAADASGESPLSIAREAGDDSPVAAAIVAWEVGGR